jgi:hypothetical protein
LIVMKKKGTKSTKNDSEEYFKASLPKQTEE